MTLIPAGTTRRQAYNWAWQELLQEQELLQDKAFVQYVEVTVVPRSSHVHCARGCARERTRENDELAEHTLVQAFRSRHACTRADNEQSDSTSLDSDFGEHDTMLTESVSICRCSDNREVLTSVQLFSVVEVRCA